MIDASEKIKFNLIGTLEWVIVFSYSFVWHVNVFQPLENKIYRMSTWLQTNFELEIRTRALNSTRHTVEWIVFSVSFHFAFCITYEIFQDKLKGMFWGLQTFLFCLSNVDVYTGFWGVLKFFGRIEEAITWSEVCLRGTKWNIFKTRFVRNKLS